MEVEKIINNINANASLVKKAIDWSFNNLKYDEKEQTTKLLKRTYNEFEKVKNSLNEKPVIAVFGASQVGKSYLIKSLLSEPNQPLNIEYNGEKYDFISRINPSGGGAESTGLVTRFTIHEDVIDNSFPIKVKLLTPKDILLIILDSFYLDLKKFSFHQEVAEIESHLFKFENEKNDYYQDFLNEFDIEDCTKYFYDHFSKYEIIFDRFEKTRFFSRIGKIIEKYQPNKWSDILSIMWNYNEKLTKLFNTLIEGLVELEFNKYGYIEFNQVLREEAILDVQKLDTLFIDQKQIKVKLNDNTIKEVSQSLMTALIAELVLKIPNQIVNDKPFLEKTDLLDFPGARTRLDIEYEDIVKDKNLEKMLLRGKVSYLFNKYSDEMNVTNLLFCINDNQNEVKEIPYLLENWIHKNIGTDPDKRAKVIGTSPIPPLFVVNTFFNKQLKFDIDNNSGFESDYNILNSKWNLRFNRLFEDGIVTKSKDWNINWIGQNQSFKNFYLLRDYKFSDDIFDGFESNGMETSVKSSRALYMSKLKESFLNYDFTKNHILEREKLWDNATSINKDGSTSIIENLSKVANNKTKVVNSIIKVNNEVDHSRNLLTKFIKSDEVEKIKKQKLSKILDFEMQMVSAFRKNQTVFIDFIENMLIAPYELYEQLNKSNFKFEVKKDDKNLFVEYLIINYPELSSCNNNEMAYDVLKKGMYLNSHNEVDEYLNRYNIEVKDLLKSENLQSKAIFYADLILNHWKGKMSFDNIQKLNLGLSNDFIDFLVEHLTFLIEKKNIRSKIIQLIDNATNIIEFDNSLNTYISESSCLIFNEVLLNFDTNLVPSEELSPNFLLNRTMKTEADFDSLFQSNARNINQIFSHKYRKWFENLKESVTINSGIITYDTEANDDLIKIVNNLINIENN
jgi:hypothetical protein